MIKERTGCIIVIIFEFFLVVMLALVPYAVYIALTSPMDVNINDNYLLKAISDMLNESNLIFINIIASIISSIMLMIGAEIHVFNSMNAMETITLELIVICIMGILLMICITQLKLVLFSIIVRSSSGGLKNLLINSIDVSVSIAGFLLCNIIGDKIHKMQAPLFWALCISFICVIFILAQKHHSKKSFVGSWGYFGSISIPIEIIVGVQKSVAATLILFFILYMGTMDLYDSFASTVLFAISSYGGLYISILSISDDINIVKRIIYFVCALILFVVLSYF